MIYQSIDVVDWGGGMRLTAKRIDPGASISPHPPVNGWALSFLVNDQPLFDTYLDDKDIERLLYMHKAPKDYEMALHDWKALVQPGPNYRTLAKRMRGGFDPAWVIATQQNVNASTTWITMDVNGFQRQFPLTDELLEMLTLQETKEASCGGPCPAVVKVTLPAVAQAPPTLTQLPLRDGDKNYWRQIIARKTRTAAAVEREINYTSDPTKLFAFAKVLDEKQANLAEIAYRRLAGMGYDKTGKWVGPHTYVPSMTTAGQAKAAKVTAIPKVKAVIPPDVTKGSIWHHSWGYDQVQNDFITVVGFTPSGKSAICRVVGAKDVGNDKVEPLTTPVGPEFKMRIEEWHGQTWLRGSYPYCFNHWDSRQLASFSRVKPGETFYETPAGMGH